MKVWFFYDDWYDHNGNIRPAYYAVIERGGHVTDGNSFPQALYMAHDLIACLLTPPIFDEIKNVSTLEEAAKEIELPKEQCIAEEDIGIDILPNWFWVRKNDPKPLKTQPPRMRMTERAFWLTYRDAEALLSPPVGVEVSQVS